MNTAPIVVRVWRCELCGHLHRAGQRSGATAALSGFRVAALRCARCDGRMLKVNAGEGERDYQHGPPAAVVSGHAFSR